MRVLARLFEAVRPTSGLLRVSRPGLLAKLIPLLLALVGGIFSSSATPT